ncbi:RDD family protein [Mycoplasma sp. CSL10137]|uniref:RDD family protein n=1 Tax=unclassified Mycoplasma TaxID=2683645 RepID=UPI00197CA21E|nr:MULTISPECIES: RDD family protein [unclassified Mycoplasma]MBN4083564.1 RDD family protein [Mycoplasma sp. CSL10137]MBU4692984.1 RDD family protein [Mycoplasma sp. CSL7491-lung]
MKKYQNSFFYKRFFSEIIDFILFLLVSIFLVWAIGIFNYAKNIPTNKLVWSTLIGIFNNSIFFIIIPLVLKGKSIGKYLLKIKIISSKNNEFDSISIIKRSTLSFSLMSLMWVLVFLVAYYNSYYVDEKKSNLTLEIINKFFQIFTYAISIFKFIDYLFIIVYKKKLSVIDIITKTRVVNKDEIIVDDIELIKLVPFYSKRRNIVYVNNKANLKDEEK